MLQMEGSTSAPPGSPKRKISYSEHAFKTQILENSPLHLLQRRQSYSIYYLIPNEIVSTLFRIFIKERDTLLCVVIYVCSACLSISMSHSRSTHTSRPSSVSARHHTSPDIWFVSVTRGAVSRSADEEQPHIQMSSPVSHHRRQVLNNRIMW